MREPVLVVGSGAAGVHCALTLLRGGCRVIMMDVGRTGPGPIHPTVPISELKSRLADPQQYFLGDNFEAIRLPGGHGEYYALPPSKGHVIERPSAEDPELEGFAPAMSHARGGLAEAWTGGCYPFNDADLRGFPVDFAVMQPYYEEAARRIGISGTGDLTPHIPWHDAIQSPLELDTHSQTLFDTYQSRGQHRVPGVHLGHARSAVISAPIGERSACSNLGRCLWGCPTSSFYVPSLTLKECQQFPEFEYLTGRSVSHALCESSRRVRAIVATDQNGQTQEIEVGTLVLAAGTLATSIIFLKSLWHAGESNPVVTGLMDNRQVHIPFLTPRMFGHSPESDAYQYHRLAMVIEDEDLAVSCHGQLTTLKAALIHPILQRMPLPLAAAINLFRNVRSGMGLLGVSYPDTRRAENQIRLSPDGGGNLRVSIVYRPPRGERRMHRRVNRRARRLLRSLGCQTFPFWESPRVMGASIHYAGTIPMSPTPTPGTVDAHGHSHDFSNLWIADASVFPSLPAKSLTLTTMANAIRVSRSMLDGAVS